MDLDYAALGFLAGLEIHQQLDTRKLFCRCPSALDEAPGTVTLRQLRPTQSELGEVDRAALAEARKRLRFEYHASAGSSCLVELDEEPPHAPTAEAVSAALEIALLLGCRVVDEVHVMRKIVIDGSNTSGFQRTALFALDGHVESSGGRVRIDTLALEEDSARKIERKGEVVAYRLDRLGIPLVEIATAPDIKNPHHAQEVALAIGGALRATGKVKRGLGTIRQDLNVSIRAGARVEIKGVQDLKLIPIAIEYEVRRQLKLLEVRETLKRRGGQELRGYLLDTDARDVSSVFANTQAKNVRAGLDAKSVVLGLPLPGFSGLLGRKSEVAPGALPEPRLGRELSDYAKVRSGVKGIFHSDELPGYGITEVEVMHVRSTLGLGPEDAFALVVAPAPQGERAIDGVRARALLAFEGVPEETREAQEDGSSSYLRPLPGGARMYPETDVPPFSIPRSEIEHVRNHLPETFPQMEARFQKDYPDVSREQVATIVRSGDGRRFERLVEATGLTKEVARVLVNTLPELEAEGIDIAALDEPTLLGTLVAVAEGEFAKEAVPGVLRHLAKSGGSVAGAKRALGLGLLDLQALEAAIDAAIAEKADFVRARGLAAQAPLMGPIMAKFRGQVAGSEISRILSERIRRFLEAK